MRPSAWKHPIGFASCFSGPMSLQPHPRVNHHKRRSHTCHRHLTAVPATGLCASCLRERLDCIQNISPTTTTTTSTTAVQPHLRRSKSSCGPNPSSASASEPRRRSCEVRSRNTLHELFSTDDGVDYPNLNPNPDITDRPCSSNVRSIQIFHDEGEEEGEFKTVKEFIDLEWGNSRRSSRKSFWESASVLSKKLSDWRRKQMKKKQKNECSKKSDPIRFRETQSEVGDTDPRLSVDMAGRFSVDDHRLSLDQPRASCDGHFIGEQNRLVGEDVNGEERLGMVKEEELDTTFPGGSVQTRHYYGDSANWQLRRSFSRSVSTRRMSSVEFDDLKPRIPNARASPEPAGLFHGAKLMVTEKELRDSNWYSLKDFRAQSGPKDVEAEQGCVNQQNKSWQWQWKKVWTFGQPRKGSKKSNAEGENGERSLQKLRIVAPSGFEYDGTLTESLALQKLRRVANADANACERLLRSYSTSKMSSSEKLVLQRNGSLRYSPNPSTNGLVNFRLWSSKSTSGKLG